MYEDIEIRSFYINCHLYWDTWNFSIGDRHTCETWQMSCIVLLKWKLK